MDSLNGLPLASFKKRAYAIAIDFLLVSAVRSLLHLNGHAENHAPEGTVGWFLIEAAEFVKHVIESTLYFAIALRVGKGQTVGKWAMKICVVSLTEPTISWWQSIERALGYGASLLEGGFGFFQYYLNKNRQTVHDRIAETIVVDLTRPRAEAPIQTDAKELAEERAGLA
jgi:uncharacterized RDD family membrane protein YckC